MEEGYSSLQTVLDNVLESFRTEAVVCTHESEEVVRSYKNKDLDTVCVFICTKCGAEYHVVVERQAEKKKNDD